MIKWFLRKGVQAFGKKYKYDVGYMMEVINASTAAGLRLSTLPLVSQYQHPKKAIGVWAGAAFASTLDGDCGPCAQLIADMSIEAGIPPSKLRMCVEGQAAKAGDVGLGFRYAQAAISASPETSKLLMEIEALYGRKAVVSAAFAAASGRFYPVLKRALGENASCARLQLGDSLVTPMAKHV